MKRDAAWLKVTARGTIEVEEKSDGLRGFFEVYGKCFASRVSVVGACAGLSATLQ